MRTRYKHGITAGAAVVALLVAAPAIGAAGSDDPGAQPPAGAKGQVAKSHFAPVPKQPAASVRGQVAKSHFAPVPKQPVNRNPQKAAPVAKVRDNDRGVKNARTTKDRGQKNVAVTRDRGAR
jgi:hypothetical protein